MTFLQSYSVISGVK